MRKWFIRIFLFIVVVDIIFFAAGGFIYYRSRSSMEGTKHFAALQGTVTITRDQYGVPHIVADKSDLDAFFALGYVHAQDRFWQMEFNRHVAKGSLSELFGDKTINADKYLRTWGLYYAAEKAWPSLSPQTKAIVEAYTNGVNAYISEHHLPIQFALLNYKPAPWTPIDTIAWQKIMAWDLQDSWKEKLKHYLVMEKLGNNKISILFPHYPKNGPTILSDADLKQSGLYSNENNAEIFTGSSDKGSNNWVVSGKLTDSKKPLLANDPHLGLQAPSMWYLAELKGPTLHVIGATTPGAPGVVLGHNDYIAWGVTNVNPDTQDLYILPNTAKITVRHEIIKVRGKPDIDFEVGESDVGPIISNVSEVGQTGKIIALKWTAFAPNDTTGQSILEINYAKNWSEFVAALKEFVVPSQNFVYADTSGNIGYYMSGKIPVRNWEASMPVPDDTQHQWQGYIPFEKMPHVFNPPENFIVTANNRAVSNHYPYAIHFRWSVPPYRAARISELLRQNIPLTIEKFEMIQQDNFSTLWQSLSGDLLKTKPLDQPSQIGLNYLNKWDGKTDINSLGATIFAYWYQQLGKLTPDFLVDLMRWPEPLFITNEIKNKPDVLSQSLQAAMNQLIKDKGEDPKNWTWGNVHHAVFNELGLGTLPFINLYWNRNIPAPGGLYTVNVGTYDFKTFNQTDGPGYRQIIDFSNFNHSLYIAPMGESNDPFNKHYQDQLELWRDGKYIPMSENVKEWGETQILTLIPKKVM